VGRRTKWLRLASRCRRKRSGSACRANRVALVTGDRATSLQGRRWPAPTPSCGPRHWTYSERSTTGTSCTLPSGRTRPTPSGCTTCTGTSPSCVSQGIPLGRTPEGPGRGGRANASYAVGVGRARGSHALRERTVTGPGSASTSSGCALRGASRRTDRVVPPAVCRRWGQSGVDTPWDPRTRSRPGCHADADAAQRRGRGAVRRRDDRHPALGAESRETAEDVSCERGIEIAGRFVARTTAGRVTVARAMVTAAAPRGQLAWKMFRPPVSPVSSAVRPRALFVARQPWSRAAA
jgi:hypothetical protein